MRFHGGSGFSITFRSAERRIVIPGKGVATNAKAQRWETQGRRYAKWAIIYLPVHNGWCTQKSRRQGEEIN